MKVFAMGTLSSMANKERYARFTKALYGVYSTMEDEMDKCCAEVPTSANDVDNNAEGIEKIANQNSPVVYFWSRHSEILRRSELLRKDILAVTKKDDLCDESSYSHATLEYMKAIREAGDQDRQNGTGRLLGHAYTRYLADLMGGSVLGTPTRLALRLEEGTPEQYSFSFPRDRKAYVETIYNDLNESGKIIQDDDALLEEIVEEARAAFRHNIEVYGEEPIVVDSARGIQNIISGYLFHTP